jgi:hypothetical protein
VKEKNSFTNLKKYEADLFALDPRIKDLSLPIDRGMPKTPKRRAINRVGGTAYFHMVPTVAALTMS